MRKILSFLSFLLLVSPAGAQYYKFQKWDAAPKLHDVPEAFRGESAVFILDQRRLEYKSSEGAMWVYRTMHRIVKVLDDKGIESFNKISISFLSEEDMHTISARTILPNGTVKEVTRDKIILTKDEDGSPAYVFAMEGVEKNAEVEYLYTEKRPLSLFGSEIHQFNIPVMRADMTIVAPDDYVFELKGYNNMPAAVDTAIGNTHYYHTEAHNIPAIDEEPYSDVQANLMKTDYRISYAKGEDKHVRLFTWNDLAKKLQEEFYKLTDKERKTVRRYLETIGVAETDAEEQKVRKIEDALKSNINMSEDITDASYLSFEKIVDKKLTTEKGFVRFFVACLTVANVSHELGITTNRFRNPLDESFENWKLLDIYVIYFPALKKYLAPSSIFHRMPFVPPAAADNKAVFCKITTLGDAVSAMASIKRVPLQPIEMSGNTITASVQFNEEMTPVVDFVHSFTGYSAMGVREAFVYTPKDKEKEIVQNLVVVASTAEDISNYKVENVAFTNYYENKPLSIEASVQAAHLVEKAGTKYLFKIGDVIGRQVEMYQEKERKLPIDLSYPHTLNRTISLQIPEGYKVANPEVLKMNVVHKTAQNDRALGFISDYKLEGNKLQVIISEYYSEVHLPKTEIEPFKKVINAAADFNKVVLVLEKI
jgi:hypothetical protein